MARRAQFKIRQGYHPDEIHRLRVIEKECFEFGVAWNLNQFKENLPKTVVWVCETKKEIVGFLVSWIERKAPYIASVEVTAGARGMGVASELISACEQYYKDLGYGTISLLVHTDNPAQRLYFSRGYRAVKLYPNCEYGSIRKNMLKMQKSQLPTQ